MVWSAIILVPVLNSQMMSEMHINLENVLIAWRQTAPYLIIFLIHNSLLAPRYDRCGTSTAKSSYSISHSSSPCSGWWTSTRSACCGT